MGKVLQEYVKAYRLAIDPLQNCDKLVEVFEPLETASKTIKMFNIPYKVEEALKPLVEISKNLNADFKKIDMLERITETMKPLTDMGKILKISDTKDNCEDDANSRKENNLLLESIKLKDKNDEEI